MSYEGTWKRTGSKNAINLMKHVGMSDEIIEKFKQSDVTMVIETIGEDSYKESYTVVGNTAVTIKKIGGESEMIDWSGEKFTVVPKRVGNKVRAEYDFKGVHYIADREVTDTTLTDFVDLDNGTVVGEFIYTKQK